MAEIFVIMFNTYREAVRARIVHGLFALAVASACYSIIVGEYTGSSALRVISDIGAASVSIFAIVVAIVMGATTLYRELELKTVFPILARPLTRGQYLVGKFLGTVLTLAVFVLANSAILLLALHFTAGGSTLKAGGAFALVTIASVLLAWRIPSLRTVAPLLWAFALVALGWVMSVEAPDDRRVVASAAALTLLEVCIITALATLFSSFSSPFLTAVFTFGVFLVGRSAESMANLPEKVFGAFVVQLMNNLSKVVPNLMIYVPPRPLLTGEAGNVDFSKYLALAAGQATLWSVGLLLVAGWIFRRKDFV